MLGTPPWCRKSQSNRAASPHAATASCECTVDGIGLAFPDWTCGADPTARLGITAECSAPLSLEPPGSPRVATAPQPPTDLRVEFLLPRTVRLPNGNPGEVSPVLGVDTLRPHFTWVPPQPMTQPAAGGRVSPAAAQSAFEITVSDAAGRQIWGSGTVNTTTPGFYPPSALPLASDSLYTAQVNVWSAANTDGDDGAVGLVRSTSEPAAFTTGLMEQSDWSGAQWIGGGLLARKDIIVNVPAGKRVSRVSVFASGCQYYKFYWDGKFLASA